ncbi:unnamed protein product [Schistosoma margrebowiei]|uniref:Uncharacterized protein n=1 Tax=Schistosoma margrebowiei TaxID=48269 RepID=A0A183MH34_9TREM|nr:unnamed protein product [Schistosoma margrebowiei]
MVVGGSRQDTLDPGFLLLGTRQQGVPAILRKLVLPGGFDLLLWLQVISRQSAQDADMPIRDRSVAILNINGKIQAKNSN